MKYLLIILISLVHIQCRTNKIGSYESRKVEYKLDTLTLLDQNRNRKIPIAIYQPKNKKDLNGIPIIFSHGYGKNKGGHYLYSYTYLTEFLASNGFFVVSIQHELPTDDLLPMTGKFKEARRPNWERGAENIRYVLKEIKDKYQDLKYFKLALIGHSNGGDISAFFAHKYPKLAKKIITLDNLRNELPRTSNPKIYTLRSKDFIADANVLPTEEELKKHKIIVQFTDINHSNMDNDATETERKYLKAKIIEYLVN